MPTPDEFFFQILMKEKEHADQQIRSYTDLQIKLLTAVFTALGVAAGWILSEKSTLEGWDKGMVLVIISMIGSFTMIQTVVIYGITLGYIGYKDSVLQPALWRLAVPMGGTPPMSMLAAFRRSVSVPVLLAACMCFLIFTILDASTLVAAHSYRDGSSSCTWLLRLGWSSFGLSLLCLGALGAAMVRVGIGHSQAR